MATKIFKQAFAKDFQGISGECSALEPDGGEVNRAVNYEYSVGNSLRGRVGCQIAGAYKFFAIFPYRYTRTQDQYDITYQPQAGTYPNQSGQLTTTKTAADGSTIQKIIGINNALWLLETLKVTVTQTNAGAYTWYTYVNGSNINFVIKKDGTSILDTSLGDGMTSSTTFYSLLGSIDALADLSVSRGTRGVCPPFAIADGNQMAAFVGVTALGAIYRWTVLNTPHTFLPGDVISWKNTSNGILEAGIVRAVSATTIDFVVGNSVGTVTDGTILGYMGQAAAHFPIAAASSETSGQFIISFPYWRYIPPGDTLISEEVFAAAYTLWQLRSSQNQIGYTDFYAPPVSENLQGNCYITTSSGTDSSAWANKLLKFDGTQITRAGLPAPTIAVTAPGAGVLTGTYRYKTFIRKVDSQGNIVDGPLSATSTITYAANYGSVVGTSGISYAAATGYGARGGYKHTAEVVSTLSVPQFFYVDNLSGGVGSEPSFQPGDLCYYLDNVTQKTGGGGANTGLWTNALGGVGLGALHKQVVTDYCSPVAVISPTTHSIRTNDTSNVTIPADAQLSAGLTMVFLRTAAGGNQFYVLCEVPITGYGTGMTFLDNVNDSVLITGEQYIEVPIGKEHDPPPSCSLVCQHQGGLVVARGLTTPNTVTFSSADGVEYFPIASNSFDVPSTQAGSISAIMSDTTDRLAVFKDKAYYDIQGDLDGGAFSVNVRNEGDYGIASHASLARVNGALVGLSRMGWVVIQDGFLDPYKFKDVSSRLINQNYYFNWAVAVNDHFNRQYLCSIPQVTGEPVTYAIDYSRNKIITLERSYTTKLDPVSGMVMLGDTLYHLSATSPYGVFRRLPRFNGDSPSGNGDGDSFIDNTNAISYILESQPINFGEPGQLKSPIRIRIWSIPNDYIIEGWVPFSLLVETGATPLAQYVGSGGTNNTSSTVTFSADTDVLKDVKLKKQKCHFYIVKFTTNTIRTAPFITGYEIMFADNYDKEDFIK